MKYMKNKRNKKIALVIISNNKGHNNKLVASTFGMKDMHAYAIH